MNSDLILERESLAGYNTYHTGGQARYLSVPKNVEQLTDVLIWADAKNIPHEIIGYGANLLVSDKGYPGVVICLREFEKWCVLKGDHLVAGAGVQLNDIVKYACDNGLKGIETLAGIYGTFGGALRMNAGAYGVEMKDVVVSINTLEGKGGLGELSVESKMLSADEALFGYRSARGLLGKIVSAAEIALTPDILTPEELNRIRKDVLAKRKERQPLEFPSCGSVFKRGRDVAGEPLYAGALIEKCGLKGFCIGGAEVSEKHANFIINTGDATSTDIYKLIKYVKAMVLKDTGVLLEEEVVYLGDF